jgi:hypothetical protein
MLLVVSFGNVGAAFATTDPITTPRNEVSTHGRWHNVFGLIFVLGFPVVTAVFAIRAIMERSPLWPWFLGMGILVWTTIALFIVLSVRWTRAGRIPGPEMPIGIPNRIFAVAYMSWTVIIALATWALSR